MLHKASVGMSQQCTESVQNQSQNVSAHICTQTCTRFHAWHQLQFSLLPREAAKGGEACELMSSSKGVVHHGEEGMAARVAWSVAVEARGCSISHLDGSGS